MPIFEKPFRIHAACVLMATCLGFGSFGLSAQQIEIEDTRSYNQTFSDVKSVSQAGLHPWEDGQTYPGWHALHNGSLALQFRATTTGGAVPNADAPTPLMLMRSSGADAALGLLETEKHEGVIGAHFVNASSGTIRALSIRYHSKQYSHNTGGPTRLPFAYSLDATSLNSGTWIPFPALDAVSVKDSSAENAKIDGNAPENFTILSSVISGLEITPGSSFWLRWGPGVGTGRHQALGIDDFSLTALFHTPSGENAPPDPVTIAWDRPDGLVTTRRHFSINGHSAFNPEIASNPSYGKGVRYMNPGLFRYHSTGMHRSGGAPGSWIDDENKIWDSKKIAAALDGLNLPGEEVLINIARWPDWMDTDGDRRLDDGRENDFAAFCAELVRIINIDQKRGIRYFEITNECDFVYWRHLLSSGNENELLGATSLESPGQGLTEKLADIYNRAAVAMKAVDPTIKTGGPAAASGESNVRPMHRRFIELTLPNLDFFSFHSYPRTRQRTPVEIYDTPSSSANIIRWHIALLRELSPNRHVELHLNEFNVASNWRLQDRRMHTEEGAVFDSLFMIECVRAGADVLNAWNECDATYGKMDKEYKLRIPAHVYHYFNSWLIGESVDVSPAGVTESGRVVAFAVKTTDGHHNFLLVNRAREAIRTRLSFFGLNPEPHIQIETAKIDADGLTTGTLPASALGHPLELSANSVNFFSIPPN